MKIGHLLALGFGHAGARIIQESMKKGHGDILGGASEKVVCIFGFCSLKNFDPLIGALDTNIMTFINLVSDIVHSEVNRGQGFSNKNLGEAFLCVWKFP